ncbi:MAG TPA: efflux RND transporter periplasmic adaptor subunit [Streptosporangiaceae bacterium]|nr:efflux RND transporter periplasmic adaptor subunit [Streptosporangiaceae bacterium]
MALCVVVVAGAVAAWRAGALSPAATSGTGQLGAPSATAVVSRQDLSAVTPVTATLGYAGSYTVTGQGGGTLTWLPSPGRVIRQGQAVYRVDNGSPVVLLYGSVPAWRTLYEGLNGADVTQLNHDLVALGDATSAEISSLGWDYYSWETSVGVQNLEGHLGVSGPAGTLSLGQLVFEPTALRVSQVTGSLGGPAAGSVLAATTDLHTVTIALNAAQQSQIRVGDRVTVTLPDETVTPGVISSLGTVAATAPGSAGSGSVTTIPVQVELTDPGAAGTLDQAPVTVNITTASVKDALAVPVTALLAQAPGGYQVEVVGPGGARRYVPVSAGIFDDVSGLVQVTGALRPGQRVVVASS